MHFHPLGDEAMVVDLSDRVDESTHQDVQRAWHAVESAQLPGVREVVPAYTSITIFYNTPASVQAGAEPGAIFPWLEARVRKALEANSQSREPLSQPRLVKIPVCYEGEFAPDLADVARQTALTPEEVVRLHHTADYFVHLIGFAPGFPYLGGLPAQLSVPRRAQPRAKVPAGSVAITGPQAGIYPLSTPGGWNLIGRTPLPLFRAEATPPALLRPGDRVKFVPISREELIRQRPEWV